jgi:hypothetical protein
MADEGTKRTDARLITFVAVAILAIGLSVMGGLWLLLRTTTGSEDCAHLTVGIAAEIQKQVHDQGPYLDQAASCGDFWAAVQNGQLVAVRTDIPGRNCLVAWSSRRSSWMCGNDPIPATDLQLWPSTILHGGTTNDAWQIDFSRT